MFNPGNMEKMMEQLGMEMDEIDAEEVRVELSDGSQMVFDTPELRRMEVQGQEMFQLQGDYTEQEDEDGQDDVALVMERTGVSEAAAREALEEHDDLTEAIMSLQ